jgi:serine/threonine protein kinase
LGKGAYGRVEKLRDKMGDKIYAGKILLKTPNSKANRYKNTKLEDEIRIYEKLNHPNIPQLHQIYTWKN